MTRTGDADSVLHDRAAITDLIYRYAHALDRRALDGIVDCFTEDLHVEFNGGEQVVRTSAGLRQFFEDAFQSPLLGQQGVSTHLMGNVLITFDPADADVAHVETQAVAYLASDGRDVIIVRGLLYGDDCVRTASGWRIRGRVHTAVWESEMPRVSVSPALSAPS
jgi:ketosteroid isomerase-like protein